LQHYYKIESPLMQEKKKKVAVHQRRKRNEAMPHKISTLGFSSDFQAELVGWKEEEERKRASIFKTKEHISSFINGFGDAN